MGGGKKEGGILSFNTLITKERRVVLSSTWTAVSRPNFVKGLTGDGGANDSEGYIGWGERGETPRRIGGERLRRKKEKENQWHPNGPGKLSRSGEEEKGQGFGKKLLGA